MIVYRISRAKYSRDLSGKGAELSGGRWNSVGRPAIYASSSVALSTVEVSVHLPLGILPIDYVLISIWMPDTSDNAESTVTKLSKLPANWRSYPFPKETQLTGDTFLQKGKTLALQVPSAAVTEDYNFILNPLHPDARHVKIEDIRPYEFDQRLFMR